MTEATLASEMEQVTVAAQVEQNTLFGRELDQNGMTKRNALICLALAGTAVVSVVGYGCSRGEGSIDDREEVDLEKRADDITRACKEPVLELDAYKTLMGDNASEKIPSIKGNDKSAIDKELLDKLPQNTFALAAFNTLIKYSKNPVNFASIKKEIATTLERMNDDKDFHEEVCGYVLDQLIRSGKNQELSSFGYLEAEPVYNREKLDPTSASLVDVDSNATVKVYTIKKTTKGTPEFGLTAKGEFLISKSVGTENGDTNVDTELPPEYSFTDQDGKDVKVKPIAGGKAEVTITDKDGNTKTQIIACGGGCNPSAPNNGGGNGGGVTGTTPNQGTTPGNGTTPNQGTTPGNGTTPNTIPVTVPGTSPGTTPTTLPPMTITTTTGVTVTTAPPTTPPPATTAPCPPGQDRNGPNGGCKPRPPATTAFESPFLRQPVTKLYSEAVDLSSLKNTKVGGRI